MANLCRGWHHRAHPGAATRPTWGPPPAPRAARRSRRARGLWTGTNDGVPARVFCAAERPRGLAPCALSM